MQKIHVREAIPGMVLAKPVTVLSAMGRELIQQGITLEKKHISKLQQWGIEYLFIESFDEEKVGIEEPFTDSIRLLARQTYEDAISSLTRISTKLLKQEDADIESLTHSVSHIMEVVSMETSILSLLSRLRTSDEYLYRHCVDVCVVALVVARKMKLDDEALKNLGTASLIHDIGMMKYKKSQWHEVTLGVKPGEVREHPLESHKLAEGITDIHPDTLSAILKHHEYSDGSGYPRGVAAADIPPMAAVLAIAEAYSTFTAPYHEDRAVSPHDAVTTIMSCKPPLFPPEVLRAFLSCVAIYPAGTFVLLSNGLRCVVIAANSDDPLRPRLLALYDADNIPVKPYHLNLTDAKNIELYIEKTVSHTVDKKPLEEILKT